MSSPPVVLTIGGSDSGGCYGVQADLRVLAARGVHGTCALTIVTAQNTTGIRAALPVPVEVVEAQIEAVLADLPVAAVKTGMLARVEVIQAVARFAAAGRLPSLVVDPVLVNRHGTAVFGPEVAEAYRTLLLPHARLTCPNRLEANLLRAPTGFAQSEEDSVTATGSGTGSGAGSGTGSGAGLPAPTLLTAGRDSGDEACDLLWENGQVTRWCAPRIATRNNAGSGDALSAHIAAGLAIGATLHDAIGDAKRRVHAALAAAASWDLGAGPGPLDHDAVAVPPGS